MFSLLTEESDGYRGHAGAVGVQKYMCACESGVWGTLCCSNDLLPLPAQDEGEMWLSLPLCGVSPEQRSFQS